MATQTSVPTPTHEASGTYRERKRGRWLVVAMALVVSMFVVFAAEARAGSFDDSPPDAVLMKSSNVLQVQGFYWAHWFYYDEEEDGWVDIYLDFYDTKYPNADVVGAGRRLHVRFRKPERPSSVEIYASTTRQFEQFQQLQRTLRPVERNGKTVAWDVFFRVNRPDREYYLHVEPTWDEVPGTHISYGGEMFYKLHVRTRA